jgi:hypothetical protein
MTCLAGVDHVATWASRLSWLALGCEASLSGHLCLRLYSPLELFFDKSWRPTKIELVP